MTMRLYRVIAIWVMVVGFGFGLGNAVDSFAGYPDARMRGNGWNVAATILFDF